MSETKKPSIRPWISTVLLAVGTLLLCAYLAAPAAIAHSRHRTDHRGHHAKRHHRRTHHAAGGRGSGDPGDDYPAVWKNAPQDSTLDTWGEDNRECTSFAAWALSSRNVFTMPFYADARNWGPRAAALGYPVNGTPAVGAIAWSGRGDHVAWVAALGSGTVFIEEYNYDYHGHYHDRWVPTGMFQYIHFKDIGKTSGGSTPSSSTGASSQPIQGGGSQTIQGSSPTLQGSSTPVQGTSGGQGAGSNPVFTVMNTSETPPDGVWFRNSPHQGDSDRVTGHGVYMNEQVQLHCYAWGDAIGPYANRLWYDVTNVSRPTNAGVANVGYLNAHYIDDATNANQIDSGVPAC